jgi:ATP-dependent Lon protease
MPIQNNHKDDDGEFESKEFSRDYRKFLFEMFPSKHLAEKIQMDELAAHKEKEKDSGVREKGKKSAAATGISGTTPGIVTRSGKVICAPTSPVKNGKDKGKAATASATAVPTTPTAANKSRASKPFPAASAAAGTTSVATAKNKTQISSKTSKKIQNDVRKPAKRVVESDPPSSNTSDDNDDNDDDDDDDDNDDDDAESSVVDNAESKIATVNRRNQALKKLLSKNLNIVITMKSGKKYNRDDDEEDDDDEDGDDDEDEDEDDEDDDEDDEDEDDDDEDDDDDDDEDDDEDEYDDDDDDDDDYDDDEEEEEEEEEEEVTAKKTAKSLRRTESTSSLLSSSSNSGSVGDFDIKKFIKRCPIGQQNYEKDEQTVAMLLSNMEELLKRDKDNMMLKSYYEQLKNASKILRAEKTKRVAKEKRKNCKEFRKMLRKRNATNDLVYFRKNLSPEEQRLVLTEIQEVNKLSFTDVPYRLSVLQSTIPRAFKSVALSKISSLRNLDPGAGEYYKVKNWVDGFMKIPFNVEKNLPVTLAADGMDACGAFMESAKKQLDDAVYGLNDAKLQIMQLVGQWISNPSAMGTAIAIQGPPGTGKTSLIKDGVSKILGRDFAFIALGGATDSSFLEGHSYTYEGSTWGQIIDILMKCKSTNPVIYFDELDKISDTPKGDEIVGILTHLTDSSQNNQFHDKYFAEINFDLSKCLFIFSYNDESRVNRVLLDRMYRIHTSGYSTKDKVCITQNYLVPKIMDQVKFGAGDITIPQEIIEHIVEQYTDKEDGVRNLKRCLEIIYTKLNLYRLMKQESISTLFTNEMKTRVSFPFALTLENLEQLLKRNETKLYFGLYL